MTTSAKLRPSQTRTGLLPEARHLVLPQGIASDSFPSTRSVCARIGITFDPWQCDLNRCILAKAASGLFAADTVLLSIPRQVGKTYDVGGVVFADSIINPGTTTVWTAHRFKVARESFNEMRAWAKSRLLAPHIDYDEITTAAGNECIPFRNGSRIVFAARERGSVRGFTKVRRLILDEAQILTELAMSDLVPTMNQAVNPQVILMCTPPKPADPSEVVTRLRADALGGESEGLLYVEISAPQDCDPLDREAWRIANPSYPQRTPAKAILRMRKLLSAADFTREALGVWDAIAGRAIDPVQWAARADPDSGRAGDPQRMLLPGPAIALDVSPEGDGTIAAGGKRADGLGHGEVIEDRPGTGWLVERAVEVYDNNGACVLVLDPASPAGAFEKDLIDRGFEKVAGPEAKVAAGKRRLYLIPPREYASACGALVADIRNNRWRHLGQKPLNDAAEGARTKAFADAFKWSRKDSSVNIAPLVAVTEARHGFMTFGGGIPEPFAFWS